MENMLLIGISGNMGSSKDSLGKDLALRVRGYFDKKDSKVRIVRHAFADKIKQSIEVMFGIMMRDKIEGIYSEEYYDFSRSQKAEEYMGVSLGEWMQRFGQSMRDTNEEVWINFLKDKINYELIHASFSMSEPFSVVIIPDVRHHNEEEYIHERGGLVFGIKDCRKYEDTRDRNHESEKHVKDINVDYRAQHNGGDELNIIADDMFEHFIIPKLNKHHV